MNLSKRINHRFNPVIDQVKQSFHSLNASGAAVLVIQNDRIMAEEYWGTQSLECGARLVQEDTQFHVASVRKSYIGFAVAYAIYHGQIDSIDDPVLKYLPDLDHKLLQATTIRHLLTHTHGLSGNLENMNREFPPGVSWAYRGVGVTMLTEIVRQTTGKTIADILSNEVFLPLGFEESGWYATPNEKLVTVMRDPADPHWVTSLSTAGDKMNMYVSARELAYWGYLHLNKGQIAGHQIVPKEMIDLATALQSPEQLGENTPRNGFLWFVQDKPANKSEIGPLVPVGSYQILGYTNVALLVVPQHQTVVVRMFNSFGSPVGYDYLQDIRAFGDRLMLCLV